MTTINHRADAAHRLEADTLVVFVAPGHPAPTVLGELPEKVGQVLVTALQSLRASGGDDEVTWLSEVPGVRAPTVAVVGIGHTAGQEESATLPSERLRRAAGAAARALAGRRTAVALLPDADPDTLTAIAEGFILGAYNFTQHRGRGRVTDVQEPPPSFAKLAGQAHAVPPSALLSAPPENVTEADNPSRRRPVAEVSLAGSGRVPAHSAVILRRAHVLGKRVAWARDQVNTAPNILYPYSFGERCRAVAPGPVDVTLLDEPTLRGLGCGGILGVGQGSTNPPMIVRLRYRPQNAVARVGFVGKGITFDSGGLCLKPAASMLTMKCDMAGAAAVAATVFAIADLQLPVAVDGWLALAENMTGSNAQRPGDVVTMADGTTCEIINTDAEGRLVLADALVLASREQPDAIVDIATLTGAAVVALGHRTAALMANDDELQGEIATAATRSGEAVWPMPITPEMHKGLESNVADRKHAGSREGGAMLAAAFLREFVGRQDGGSIPWGHLDIAGPSFNSAKPYGYTPKGATGFGVRTLLCLAESRM